MNKEYDACAAMYLEAHKLDPNTLGYLYSAARCEQKAGKFDRAIEHYSAVLARASSGDPLALKSAQHKAECEAAWRKVQADKAEAARKAEATRKAEAARKAEAQRKAAALAHKAGAPGVAAKQPDGWRKPTGWATIAVGVAAVGAGVYLLNAGSSELAELEAQLAKRDANDKIIGITYDDAEVRQGSANRKTGLGGALLGAGLLSGGIGAWLVWTSPGKRVSVKPYNRFRGVHVTMRF